MTASSSTVAAMIAMGSKLRERTPLLMRKRKLVSLMNFEIRDRDRHVPDGASSEHMPSRYQPLPWKCQAPGPLARWSIRRKIGVLPTWRDARRELQIVSGPHLTTTNRRLGRRPG